MSGLALNLLDGWRAIRIDGVSSVVAADARGQFGLLPGHEAFVTVLEPGLFRYRVGSGGWDWGACVGGLLSCALGNARNEVCIVSRRFLQGERPEALQEQLDALLQRERSLRVSTRESRERLDVAFYKRMQQLAQEAQP